MLEKLIVMAVWWMGDCEAIKYCILTTCVSNAGKQEIGISCSSFSSRNSSSLSNFWYIDIHPNASLCPKSTVLLHALSTQLLLAAAALASAASFAAFFLCATSLKYNPI